MAQVIGWALAAMEGALAWMIWRRALALFPAFFCYLTLTLVSQMMFVCGFYHAHLFLQVVGTPLKLAAACEAIYLRFRFVRDGTPTKFRGEIYWLIVLCSGVAVMFLAAAGQMPMQYNVPPVFGRIRALSELTLASILFVVWMYGIFRPPKSPRRSRGHVALLCIFFSIRLPNLIAFQKGEGVLWGWVSVAGMVAQIAVIAGWLWLFWPTQDGLRRPISSLIASSR